MPSGAFSDFGLWNSKPGKEYKFPSFADRHPFPATLRGGINVSQKTKMAKRKIYQAIGGTQNDMVRSFLNGV